MLGFLCDITTAHHKEPKVFLVSHNDNECYTVAQKLVNSGCEVTLIMLNTFGPHHEKILQYQMGFYADATKDKHFDLVISNGILPPNYTRAIRYTDRLLSLLFLPKPELRTGRNVAIAEYSYGNIYFEHLVQNITIGKYVSIATTGTLVMLGGEHQPRFVSTSPIENMITGQVGRSRRNRGDSKIGNDVWIGSQVTILSGVEIADGCIVGAGSVINRSFLEPYSIIAGNPAKVVKKRFSDAIIEKLLKIRWWELDHICVSLLQDFILSEDIEGFIAEYERMFSWYSDQEIPHAVKGGSLPYSALATRVLSGLKGLEIGGASHNQFGLDTLHLDYNSNLRGTYYGTHQLLNNGKIMQVDVVGDGCLLPFKNKSFDFVINSHVLEHAWDPIAVIVEWIRVSRKYVFMIIPHKERTFDKDRDITRPAELIQRHKGNIPKPESNIEDHLCVWDTESFLELCLACGFHVHVFADADDKFGNGFTVVIDCEKSAPSFTKTAGYYA